MIRRRQAVVLLAALVVLAVGCTGGPNAFRLRQKSRDETAGTLPDQPNAYGYLQNGPVFAGSQVSATVEPTATERVVELQKEADQLRVANTRLEQTETDLKETIVRQEETLAQAEKELGETQHALQSAYSQFAEWKVRMDELHGHVQENEQNQRRALDELDQFVTLLINQRAPTQPSLPPAHPMTKAPTPVISKVPSPSSEPEELPAPARLRPHESTNDGHE